MAGAADARVAKAKPKPVLSAYQVEQGLSPTQLIARWQPLVNKAAKQARVPAAWINAVMRVESGGRTMLSQNQRMVSPKGAQGLMQVLPGTYQEMRAQYGLGTDPFNPGDNIKAGAGYLHFLKSKYDYPALFAAYNAGPGQIDDVLGGKGHLPLETRNYIARIGAILGLSKDGTLIDAVKLTRPDGTPVQVDPLAVSAVREVFPGEYPEGVQTVVQMGRLTQGVQEPVAAATKSIRARGGKI